VYKWQVFLGGIASATFVLAGAAAPALAQTVASSPLASLTQTLPGLSVVTGEIPGLSSMSSALPDLSSAASQAPAKSLAASTGPSSVSMPLSGATVPSLGSNEPSSAGTAARNTLNGVTGTLPVSSLTGGLPNLGNVTRALSGVTGPHA
jgi:hypothetical protein